MDKNTPTYQELLRQNIELKAKLAIKVSHQDTFDLARHNKIEKQLQAQNHRYSTLLANIKGMVYRCKNDRDWNMLYISEGCKELTGYMPEDLINNKALPYNDLILPKFREEIWNLWQEKLMKGVTVENEYQIQTATGEIKWVWERGQGIFDKHGTLLHLEGLITDITNRKRTEEKALKLTKAVEQSPETIVITNRQGIIEYANPTFEKLTGYSVAEATGLNPRVLQSGEHNHEYYKNLWATILSGKTWYGEFLNKKKNGELYWEHASISPIYNDDKEITHFVAVKEDITNNKNILADLKIAKEKAEESDRLKSAFLANMSHEIRTPMNGILGFADLLKEPGLSGDAQKKYIHVIEASGERMLNLINDLIDLSKIEAGQAEFIQSDLNINKQLQQLLTFFQAEANQKNLKITCNSPLHDEEAYLITDADKLFAILSNLIKNSIKYTHEGSIDFGYKIVEKTHDNTPSEYIQFYVNDTGIGIAADRQQAIFDRFVQADLSIAKPYEGAGLGLAITQAYVKIVGGEIKVNSQLGKGSEFIFTLPFQKPLEHSSNTPEIESENKNTSENTLSELTILLAEDDDVAVLFIDEILEGKCKKLLHASTGTEALEIFQQNKDIDLILMDIKMPEMDGYTATRKIRKTNQKVIIIAQTAYALVGDQQKALDAGCNGYISKPIDKQKLIHAIELHFH